VSGTRFGTDAAVLRAALRAPDAHPVAVTATGIDQLYPSGHRTLLREVAEHGAIVSVFPPGAAINRARAHRAAGLLAALAGASLVVEATQFSRSLTVAAHTLALGRPTFAVPGPVTSAASAGVHQLMRTNPHVRLVRDSSDVIRDLNTDR
jgi:DNA processing protein